MDMPTNKPTGERYGVAAIHAAYFTRYAAYADALENTVYRRMADEELEHIAYAMGFDLVKRQPATIEEAA